MLNLYILSFPISDKRYMYTESGLVVVAVAVQAIIIIITLGTKQKQKKYIKSNSSVVLFKHFNT